MASVWLEGRVRADAGDSAHECDRDVTSGKILQTRGVTAPGRASEPASATRNREVAIDVEQRRCQRHEIAKVGAANLVAVGNREREDPVSKGERRRVGAVALVVQQLASVRGGSRAVYVDREEGQRSPATVLAVPVALKVALNGTCVVASEAPREAVSEDVLGAVGPPELSQPRAKAAVINAATEIFGMLGCIMAVLLRRRDCARVRRLEVDDPSPNCRFVARRSLASSVTSADGVAEEARTRGFAATGCAFIERMARQR